jgi:hypothetical protein
MFDNLNSRVFAEQLHTTFQVRLSGSSILALELVEVTEKDPASKYEQFSLTFTGPLAPHFPQGTYSFEHEKLGAIELFAVPLGPAPGGMRYEVIFNRPRQSPK